MKTASSSSKSSFVSTAGAEKSVNMWAQQGSVIKGTVAINSTSLSLIGFRASVSDDGTILALGAPNSNRVEGCTQILMHNGSAWSQMGEKACGGRGGTDVSLSADGRVVAVSAPFYDGKKGRARILEWNGSAWKQRGASIDGEVAGDQSGSLVSLSANGNIVAVAGRKEFNSAASRAIIRVHNHNGSHWTQMGQEITASEMTARTFAGRWPDFAEC